MTSLSCASVSFSYQKGEQVLHDCTVSFESGIPNYVVGPSGCGKTTLALILAGVLTPQSGNVTAMRQQSVAYVLQFPERMFLAHTVEAELGTLPNATSTDRARGALATLGINLGEILHTSPLSLSFGQRRLLAIALQASLGTCALLLDEPTLGLDEQYLERLIRWVAERTKSGQLIILITHDYDLIRAMPGRIAILDRGAVAWQGDSDVFLKSDELMRTASAI